MGRKKKSQTSALRQKIVTRTIFGRWPFFTIPDWRLKKKTYEPPRKPEVENGVWWRPVQYLARVWRVTPNGVLFRFQSHPQEQVPEVSPQEPDDSKRAKSLHDKAYRQQRAKACMATHKALTERFVKPQEKKAVA